jgi:putative hemolysin
MKCKIHDQDKLNEEISLKILNFRNTVFDESYNRNIKDEWSIYDEKAIHFVVYDDDENIIGYYRTRLFSKENVMESQASDLFDLKYFETFSLVSLELSRACVHKNYRDGSVISLLWTKISEFLLSNNIKYCFGTTSAKKFVIDDFYWIVYHGNILTYPIMPKNINQENLYLDKIEEDDVKKKNVTTLIRAYGKQGALFCPYPAYDSQWQTYDYFTVFETKSLVKKFRKLN